MVPLLLPIATAIIATAVILPPSVGAQQVSPKQAVPLSADAVCDGWSAKRLLDHHVRSKTGQDLGMVRNIVLANDGNIVAVVVEGSASSSTPEFVIRIPRERLDITQLPNRIVADFAPGPQSQFGLFSGKAGVPTLPTEFTVREVIGDYARLQTGQGYGYVSDVVFSPAGHMQAVLVIRDSRYGGGTVAFGFPGTTGRWNPEASYYGLPYVTGDHANAAGVSIRRNNGAACLGQT
jgi:sporulation protein YlmC with PRC-barrel domain